MTADEAALARKLKQLLDAIDASSGYSDELVNDALVLHHRLRPAYVRHFGQFHLPQTKQHPYRVWSRRWYQYVIQLLAGLEAEGTYSTSPPESPSVWEVRELAILRSIAEGEEAGAPLGLRDVVESTGLDDTSAENGLRALLDASYVKGIDVSSFTGFDVLELRLLERGRRELGFWPANGRLNETDDEDGRTEAYQDAYDFDVAVSFAGSDRQIVEHVVEALKTEGLRVWYDKDKTADLWGEELSEVLADVYANRARYVMVFLSGAYTERDWTQFELEIANKAAKRRATAYVLPVILTEDVPPIVGLAHTVGYIDLRQHSPQEVARLLHDKLRPPR